jgi:hypothetical protein
VNLPGGTVTFTAGRNSQCVVVNFSSMSNTTPGDLLMVRAVLDGSVVGTPAETQFDTDSPGFSRTHAAQFVFPSVAQGPHTVRIQFRSFFGGQVWLHRGVTAVASK